MNKYLLHYEGKGRIMDIDTTSTTADQWGDIERDFAKEARGGRPDRGVWERYADAIRIWPDQVTPQGIAYDYELAGPGGGSYRLLVIGDIASEVVTAAKEWLRRSFDVVRLAVYRIELI